MTVHHVNEACKMRCSCIFFIIVSTYVMGSACFDDSNCDHVYDYVCYTSHNSVAGVAEQKAIKAHDSCSVDNLADDVKFVVKLLRRHPRTSGVLEAKFTLPDVPCRYDVALLVNSSVTNDRDCKTHAFHKTNSYEEEIHSDERSVCVFPGSNRTGEHSCKQRDKFSMWYEHVFTGCYALRFTVDGYKFAVLGNRFIATNYTRKEVTEPKFRCYYKHRTGTETSSQELVTFALSISVHDGTAGMILALTSMSYLEETKENACIRYSEPPLYTWKMSMAESAKSGAGSKNCSVTTVPLDNETFTRDTECNFAFRAPRNASYCFKIELEDVRCSRQSVWNPPPDGSGGRPPCIWLQRCTRIVNNVTTPVEYNGVLSGSQRINAADTNTLLLLPVAVIVLLVVLVIITAVFFLCRSYFGNTMRPIYVNANPRDFKLAGSNGESDSVETIEGEITQESIGEHDREEESEQIVLLYARGTTAFMNLMTDFRDILETHCCCRVRDWYDASEWDEVARIGPSAWVETLLRGKDRAVWIDTPKARNLLDLRRRNNYSELSRRSDSTGFDDPNVDTVGDFRDAALLTVLDSAKRNVTSFEYNKHFVVRLEVFGASDGRGQDPFEDLSPHTRYLLPHHLSELCSHLSFRPEYTIRRRLLTSDEMRLSQHLVQMRKNSPSH